MEKTVLLICCSAGFFGLLSAVTGFGAEVTKIKDSEVQFVSPTQCVYPNSPAMILGLTAVWALVMAQAIISVATWCLCCKRNSLPSKSNWIKALVCFVISWFAFFLSFLLLLTGATLNAQQGKKRFYLGYYCYVAKPGIFAGGAVLSLASVILAIFYYLTLTSSSSSSNKSNNSWAIHPNQHDIAMGHPHINPHSPQEAVFVPKETYLRRQFT